MLEQAAREGVRAARVHALLDGATCPRRARSSTSTASRRCSRAAPPRDYRVASGGGRMKVTMDRYERRVGHGRARLELHVRGEGGASRAARGRRGLRAESPGSATRTCPASSSSSATARPWGPFATARGGALQLSRRPRDRDHPRLRARDAHRLRPRPAPRRRFAGMMQYDGDLRLPKRFLVTPRIDRTLGEHLAGERLMQLACSETQKFGHVTYFWNGNRTEALRREARDVRGDPERHPALRGAPLDEGRGDHRPRHRELKTGATATRASTTPTATWWAHRRARRGGARRRGGRPLRSGGSSPRVLALGGALLVTADHGNADEMFELDKKSKQPAARQERRSPGRRRATRSTRAVCGAK
jgi:2,3-bisphosphoglycerate-independent phosphoglycerate mutase